jgi:RNA polymerase sigma-70 factor (ECF subfamily)
MPDALTPAAAQSPPDGEPSRPSPAPDASDIERLFREHNAALLRFVAAKLGSEHEAKEVAQEAYVRLLRLNHPEAISYLRAFLYKTAANLALDRLRARSRTPPICSIADMDLAVFHLSPDRQIEGEQSVAILRNALAELPAKSHEAFVLHKVHGWNQSEIAARMNLTERMVRRHLARALEYLRVRLDRESRP